MDIKGAKALKDRLGPNRADDTPPATADVPDDAPPVYHWLGVPQAAPDVEDDQEARGTTLFSRLGLSFR